MTQNASDLKKQPPHITQGDCINQNRRSESQKVLTTATPVFQHKVILLRIFLSNRFLSDGMKD